MSSKSTTTLDDVPKSYYDPTTKAWTTLAPSVESAIQCECCGKPLVRLDSGWLCNQCPLLNQRIIDDAVVRNRLEPVAKEIVARKVETEIEKMVTFLCNRSNWASRVGVVVGLAGVPKAGQPVTESRNGNGNGKPGRKKKSKDAAKAAVSAEEPIPPPISE